MTARSMLTCLLFAVVLSLAGCSSEAMKPGDLSLVQIFSDHPRAGNVYLLRGFIGIWSTGIDRLVDEINKSGVRANVYRCEQWREGHVGGRLPRRGAKCVQPMLTVQSLRNVGLMSRGWPGADPRRCHRPPIRRRRLGRRPRGLLGGRRRPTTPLRRLGRLLRLGLRPDQGSV